MKIKKIIAAVAAAAIAVSTMAVTAFAGYTIPEGSVVIGYGDGGWTVGGWGKDNDAIETYCTPVAITGNGTYTVKVDNGAPVEGIGAMGLCYNSTDIAVGFDVTSVKFDGTEYTLLGSSYTNDEDGGRRTNICNPWAKMEDKEDHISLNPSNATADLVGQANIGTWTTCEVTFNVYGMANDAAGATTTSDAPAADNNTESSGTGNTAAMAIVSVMAIAGVAAIAAKKRK